MVFKGWTTESEYNNDTELLTIEQVRTEAMETVGAASFTSDATVTYYAAVFKSYTITYLSDDDSPITVGMVSVDYPAYKNDGTEVVYPVNMGYTVDDKHNFEGWVPSDDTKSKSKFYPTDATSETVTIEGQTTTTVYYYPNDTEITITGDITFVVRAPEGKLAGL